MNIHQKEIFFFTHAITILCLFTYSVCDETVKSVKNIKKIIWILKNQWLHLKWTTEELPDSVLDNYYFFTNVLIIFLNYYYTESMFLTSLTGVIFYFLITYGVCKKRKYCNRMSEKKILSFWQMFMICMS